MAEDPAPPKPLAGTGPDSWLGSPTYHLHVSERLDESFRPVWEAATSQVLDLLARVEITMGAEVLANSPDHLEIVLDAYEQVGALDRVLSGLDGAGYRDWTLLAAFGGPPTGAFIAPVERDQVPGGNIIMIRVDRKKTAPVERPAEDAS